MHTPALDAVLTRELSSRLEAPTAESTGLPNLCYTSETWLELDRARLFARTWMLAGFRHRVARPGDVCPVRVAGLPLVLTCDPAGQIRAFHNVCRHRGAMLVDSPRTGLRGLTCPYHGWTYDLDGRLRSRPHFHGAGRHDLTPSDSLGLAPVRLATWNDLVFVDLSGTAPPFEQHWQPFADRTAAYDFSALCPARTLTFDVKGNWKLIYENFFDPYHVPVVHPKLEVFTPLDWRHETAVEGAWFYNTNGIAEAQEGRGLGMPYYPRLDANAQRTEWYFHLFPTLCFEIWPDQLAVFELEPIAPDRTLEHIHLYFVGEAAGDDAHAGARQSVYDMWNELNTEDFRIVENMQQARSSPGFDGGVLSPYWDPAVREFARLVVGAVG